MWEGRSFQFQFALGASVRSVSRTGRHLRMSSVVCRQGRLLIDKKGAFRFIEVPKNFLKKSALPVALGERPRPGAGPRLCAHPAHSGRRRASGLS
jgi:hypothetical protein